MALSNYANAPFGTNYAGISLKYGNTVPNGAVNLAYVQDPMPNPYDVVTFIDDISNPSMYSGNVLNGTIYQLTQVNNTVIDPNTGLPFVGLTDNFFFTTVTKVLIDESGVQTEFPLFYIQHLRNPIPSQFMTPELATAVGGGIPNESRYRPDPAFEVLDRVVNVVHESKKNLPTGYLYKVLPDYIDSDGNLYLRLFTNFKGTFQNNYRVRYHIYEETMNVRPAFLQSMSLPVKNTNPLTFSTNAIPDTGTIIQTNSVSNNDTPSTTLYTYPKQKSKTVSFSTELDITPNITALRTKNNIAANSYTAGYYDNAGGFKGIAEFGAPNWQNYFYANAHTYSTDAKTLAPVDDTNAIRVYLNSINCTQDTHGDGYVMVSILNPKGVEVFRDFYTNNAPRTVNGVVTGKPNAKYVSDGTATIVYQDPKAIKGQYTIYIGGYADGSYNVAKHSAQGQYGASGTFSYPVSWQGHYGWTHDVTTSYNTSSDSVHKYSTPSDTTNPVDSTTAIGLTIFNITAPSNGFGYTFYDIDLIAPNGSTVISRRNVRAVTNISYTGGAGSGSYTWVIKAKVNSFNNGGASYNCSFSATHSYAELTNHTTFIGNDGLASTYQTTITTVAPTSINLAISLHLSNITTTTNASGSSAVQVILKSPSGNILLKQTNIHTAPQTFTYYDINALPGVYTWSINGVVTPGTAGGAANFPTGWSGNYSYYIQDNPNPNVSSLGQTSGFNFSTNATDGSIWATTDTGPQIYLQQPSALSADDNWYIKIHRGWLNYTDPNNNNFLVGLAPYYKQNFNNFIPVIEVENERATILSSNSVQVKNRPILFELDYQVDVVLTRINGNGTTTDTWLTRDNGLSSGNYVDDIITDIISSKGIITLDQSSVYFVDSDVVHVTYNYLEYYYDYRGFSDGLGRFIHLDLNPAAGHTYSDIWNLASAGSVGLTTQAFAGSGTTTVQVEAQSHNLNQLSTLTGHATGSSGYNLLTTTNPVPAIMSTFYAYNSNASVAVASASGLVNSISIAASGSVSIDNQGRQTASALQSFSLGATAAPIASGTAITIAVSGVVNNGPQGAIPVVQYYLYDPNSNLVAFGDHTNNGSASVFNQPLVVTYYNPNAISGTYTLKLNAYPKNAGSLLPQNYTVGWSGKAYYYTNPVLYFNTIAAGASSYTTPSNTLAPATPSTQLSLALNSVSTPSDANGVSSLTVNLFDPNNTLVYSVSAITSAKTINYYNSAALAGSYTWQIQGQVHSNNIASHVYNTTSSGTQSYFVNSAKPIQLFQDFSTAGGDCQITTDSSTVAPTSLGTALSFNINNIVAASTFDTIGTFGLTLTDPLGNLVSQWHGITQPSTYTYWNPNAISGAYVWDLYPKAEAITSNNLSQNFGSLNLSCNTTGTYAGFYNLPVNTLKDPNTFNLDTYVAPGSAAWFTWVSAASALSGVVWGPGFVDASGNTLLISASGSSNGNVYYNGLSVGAFSATSYVTANCNTFQVGIRPLGSHQYTLTVYYVNSSTGALTTTFNNTITMAGFDETTVSPTFFTSDTSKVFLRSYYNSTTQPYNIGNASWTLSNETLVINASASAQWSDYKGYRVAYYTNQDGQPSLFTTDAYAAAPKNISTQLTFNITSINAPTNQFGYSYLTVQLFDPNNQLLQTWTNISTATTLTYSNVAAISGQYSWIVTASCNNSSRGIATYNVTYSGSVGWYELGSANAIFNSPTVELTYKEIFLYLTQDGYPFHAVLDAGNDPNVPLIYDTYGALTGTRYALVPTISAFGNCVTPAAVVASSTTTIPSYGWGHIIIQNSSADFSGNLSTDTVTIDLAHGAILEMYGADAFIKANLLIGINSSIIITQAFIETYNLGDSMVVDNSSEVTLYNALTTALDATWIEIDGASTINIQNNSKFNLEQNSSDPANSGSVWINAGPASDTAPSTNSSINVDNSTVNLTNSAGLSLDSNTSQGSSIGSAINVTNGGTLNAIGPLNGSTQATIYLGGGNSAHNGILSIDGGILNIYGGSWLTMGAFAHTGNDTGGNGALNIMSTGSLTMGLSDSSQACTLTIIGTFTIANANLALSQNSTIQINNCGILPYFTYTQGTGHTINFVDKSYVQTGNSIVSWHWDFGDSNTSNVQSPSHTYSASGTYNVIFTTTDNNGYTSTCNVSTTVA